MNKPIKITWLLLALLITSPVLAQDAKDIVRKADEKLRGTTSSYAEMTITTVRPTWSREMTLKSWSKGTKYSMILITSPVKDKGIVYLKRGKEVWNWIPSIERTIKLPPSMMSQSWMGTDLSNDDLVRESSMVEDFTHKILKDTTIQGRSCWKIQLIPKEDAIVVWGKIHSFIDKKDYLQLRTELFDEDEDLVNVMNSYAIKKLGGRMLASKMEIIPVGKRGQKTIMEYKTLVLNQKMEDTFFSTQNMKRVK